MSTLPLLRGQFHSDGPFPIIQTRESMRVLVLFVLVASAVGMCSCASAPQGRDPFDVAVEAAVGVMAGGIVNVNEGGVR